MKWGKNVIIASVIILFLITAVSVSAPLRDMFYGNKGQGEIAYVDLEAVFNTHPARKEAESLLNQKASEMQQEMEQKAADVERENLQDMIREYQQQLTDVESDLLADLLKEIDSSIKAVAEQKEVKLVLEKRNVLYGGYDITGDVIDYIEADGEANQPTD
ncbi:MAG: OmpH family outer membrane protein [Bacillota bacterium]